jgi:CRISPR-associated endonuclease Csn1
MTQRINYGIDPGERSLAVAAVRADAKDLPISVEALSLVLHDGGVAEEKTTTSRLAKRGEKRRIRKRFRRRRSRKHVVRNKLTELGFPVVTDAKLDEALRDLFGDDVAHAAFPYFARTALLEPISDKRLADHLFAVAAMHVDRHRGWRNPWTRFPALLAGVRNGLPAKKQAKTIEGLNGLHMTVEGQRWNEAVGLALRTKEPRTLGECAAKAVGRGSGVKPTDFARRKAMGEKKDSLDNTNSRIKKAKTAEDLRSLAKHFALPVRPTQHDLLYELMLCADIQGIDPGKAEAICEEVFFQERPGVGAELVGPCAIYDGTDRPLIKRAPEFLTSVQEMIVRQFIANLRIQTEAGADGKHDVRRLSADECDLLSNVLLDLPDREKASIRALEAALTEEYGEKRRIKRGVDARTTDDEEAVYAGKPPIDRTNMIVDEMQRQAPSFYLWWKDASRDDRELLLSHFDEVTRTDDADELFERLTGDGTIDPEELEAVADKLPDGRSPYCRRAVQEMLPLLREGKDLFEARQQAFGLPNDWGPRGARWDRPRMNHPVLQVVRSQIAPILTAMDREVGLPDSIRIEVSRQTLRLKRPNPIPDQKLKERRARNDNARAEAKELGLKGKGAVRKLRIIRDQNQQCAYALACDGRELDPLKSEIDHIVPASVGANNSRENLVATCEACNRLKADRPFAVVATEEQMDAMLEKVKTWNLGIVDRSLEKRMIRRLKTTDPEDLDERSPTTTAQIATELRGMLRDRYDLRNVPVSTESIMASLAGEARFSSGMNDVLTGARAGGKQKSRIDHRNHVVDAVVAACINPKVIPILERRAQYRESARMNEGTPVGEEELELANGYAGDGPYFGQWLERMQALAKQVEQLMALDKDPNSYVEANGSAKPLDLDVVAPRRPLRLKAYGGPLHEETAHALRYKLVGDAWTKDELACVAEPSESVGLLRMSMESRNKLPLDPTRELHVNGMVLPSDYEVALVHTPSAIAVRDASFIAGSIHHVRIYVVETKKGEELAFVPIYAVDVAQALASVRENGYEGDRRSTQIPLPPECASFRSSVSGGANAVRRLFAGGEVVEQVGWIAPGDEIWVEDPTVVRAVPAESMPVEWRDENRWYCTGVEKFDLNIRPLVMSADLPTISEEERKAPIKCRLSWSEITSQTIVRRDGVGRPRSVQHLGVRVA